VVNIIYSIGYSGLHINDFVYMLKQNNIQVVIDVRSSPYSKRFTEYNKELLNAFLNKYGIYYRNYSVEFGARQEDRQYYSDSGVLDFEKFSLSESFTTGFNIITNSMENDYTFVLMCSEKDPFECHRSIMISRVFHMNGYKVNHLLSDGKSISQEEIELRLLDKYFPKREQISFCEALSEIDSPNENENLLVQAYRKRNSEIGYHLHDEEKL